jgi:ribosomal protein S18 acetylase RimI-like enzyme
MVNDRLARLQLGIDTDLDPRLKTEAIQPCGTLPPVKSTKKKAAGRNGHGAKKTDDFPTKLRLARGTDSRLLLQMMSDFTAGEGIAPDPRRLRTALGNLLRERNLGRVWLIVEGGEVVGYAVLTFGYDLEFTGRDAFLTELYVSKELRGRGIGRRALAMIERQAVALKARAVHLMVRAENIRAFTLYASAGYEAPRRVMLSRIVNDRN